MPPAVVVDVDAKALTEFPAREGLVPILLAQKPDVGPHQGYELEQLFLVLIRDNLADELDGRELDIPLGQWLHGL